MHLGPREHDLLEKWLNASLEVFRIMRTQRPVRSTASAPSGDMRGITWNAHSRTARARCGGSGVLAAGY